MNITTPELLEALAASLKSTRREANIPPNVFSSQEIRGAMGWGNERFSKVMRAMLEAGTAEVVTVQRTAITGRPITVHAYRILPVKRKRAA